jgi:hypothetical protein
VILAKHGDPRSDSFRCILAWELAAGQNNLKRVAQKYLVPRIVAMTEVIRRGIDAGELRCSNPTLSRLEPDFTGRILLHAPRDLRRQFNLPRPLQECDASTTCCEFLLKNFIASYAVDRSKSTLALPAEIDQLAA